MKQFLTAIVERTLRHLSKTSLLSLRFQDTRIPVLLSVGISHYIDSSDKGNRVNGMRVARAYSAIVDREIHFEELEAFERAASASASSASSGGSGGSGGGSGGSGGTDGGGGDVGDATQVSTLPSNDAPQLEEVEEGFDSDDYDMEEYDTRDSRQVVVNYLQDCLTMLRVDEKDAQARPKMQAALESIPKLLRTQPHDTQDLCLPLTRELASLVNAYCLDDFDSLRDAALVAVVVAEPRLTVPFLTDSLLDGDLPMGLRLMCTQWLRAAARAVHSISSMGYRERDALALGRASAPSVLALMNMDASKTVVKRPAKLAQLMRQKQVPFPAKGCNGNGTHQFSDVAELFVLPVLQVLRVRSAELLPLQPSAMGMGMGMGMGSPGFDSLLHTQALVALCDFVKFSTFTTRIREFGRLLLRAAFSHKEAAEPSLRAAALLAMYTAIEALLVVQENSGFGSVMDSEGGGSGGVEVEIASYEARREGFPASASASSRSVEDGVEQALFSVVEWAVSSMQADEDLSSRKMKTELLNLAMAFS